MPMLHPTASSLSASREQQVVEPAAAAGEEGLGAAGGEMHNSGQGEEPTLRPSWQHLLGNSCWVSNITLNL